MGLKFVIFESDIQIEFGFYIQNQRYKITQKFYF